MTRGLPPQVPEVTGDTWTPTTGGLPPKSPRRQVAGGLPPQVTAVTGGLPPQVPEVTGGLPPLGPQGDR